MAHAVFLLINAQCVYFFITPLEGAFIETGAFIRAGAFTVSMSLYKVKLLEQMCYQDSFG